MMYILFKVIKHGVVLQYENLEYVGELVDPDKYNLGDLYQRGYCYVWKKIIDGVSEASHVIINMDYENPFTLIHPVKKNHDLISLIREIKIHLIID